MQLLSSCAARPGVTWAQFTALDRPDRVNVIEPCIGIQALNPFCWIFESVFGFHSKFFVTELAPAMRVLE